MSDSRALWLGKPAPRYTSYPPATQFRPVAAGAAPTHLAELAASAQPISLYVHIPFCRSLCLFCGCHQVITQRSDRISAYLAALQQETKLVREQLGRALAVSHLHFGGGSPSTLTPAQFHELMDALENAFDFIPGTERAMELDPRTTSNELITALAARGINRASLGVQDFNPQVQQVIHRVQPYEMVAGVMTCLRAARIAALSLDLMYGLPYQTTESVAHTAQQTVALKPLRISLFSYAHVPGFKTYQKALEQAGLPDDETKLKLEAAMRGVFERAGYVPVGIDHFAMPDDALAIAAQAGKLGRNFQGYTNDSAPMLLGLGASSISDSVNQYVQNEPDLELYQQRLAAGDLPLKRYCGRDADDHRRGAIIRELMCNFAAELGDMSDLTDALARLQPYIKSGLVKLNGSRLEVDTTTRMAVRMVAACFDAYYDAGKISSKVA
jgi:oxygen-independent coproporphyrinogen-3 oxidase